MRRIVEDVMLVKIAPGKKARLWEECRLRGYIRVGWDGLKVGDLRRYSTRDELAAAIQKSRHSRNPSTVSRITNELWTVKNLQQGDQVVANRGQSEVLGVGTVMEPAYEWDEDQQEYRHKVNVEWDTSCAKHIPKQGSWRNAVVPRVPASLFRRITGITVKHPIDWDELEKAKRRTLGSAKHRPGQPRFRSRLITLYGGRCAVTGCAVEEALEAAHIYTLSGKDENDPANGVLLRADMHVLFDRREPLWRIERDGPEFRIVLAPSLKKHGEYGKYHGQAFRLPVKIEMDRFCSYLQKRARWYTVS